MVHSINLSIDACHVHLRDHQYASPLRSWAGSNADDNPTEKPDDNPTGKPDAESAAGKSPVQGEEMTKPPQEIITQTSPSKKPPLGRADVVRDDGSKLTLFLYRTHVLEGLVLLDLFDSGGNEYIYHCQAKSIYPSELVNVNSDGVGKEASNVHTLFLLGRHYYFYTLLFVLFQLLSQTMAVKVFFP